MSFERLSPVERVALAERHLAQLPAPLGSPRLGVGTLEQMRHLRLALCDDEVSDEAFAELAADWAEHLRSLDAHTADAARFELTRFTQIVDGLHRPAEEGDR